MQTDEVCIDSVDPGGDVAVAVLSRYYDDLDRRFPEGFDVEQTVAAPVAELVPPHGCFLVLFVGGEPVGCGAVRVLDGTTAEIKRMYLDPTVRERGLGRRLLGALEHTAIELGRHTVRLDTSAHLTEAIALYRSSGYRDIPAYNSNQYAAHWLQKLLP
nr:GNAT family N-acetyltransferase [Micromonospora sp. DSM 115978]